MNPVTGKILRVFPAVMVTLVVVGAAGVGIALSGLVNVSAMNNDPAPVEWFLSTTIDRSVARHSKGITAPSLTGKERIAEGFEHFDAMCESCHGSPGSEPSVLAKGLNPHAPDLTDTAQEWTAEQIFWITKYGVKMTGMPAWGTTHSDEEIWNIVAFVKRLPEVSPAEYQRLRKNTTGDMDHARVRD